MTLYKPMLATPTNATKARAATRIETLRPGDWLFQQKIDGVRVIAYVGPTGTVLRNRNGVDVTSRFPELGYQCDIPRVYDGEVVCVSGSFADTAIRDKQQNPADVLAQMKIRPVVYEVFDLLEENGVDLTGHAYLERLRRLDLAARYQPMSGVKNWPGDRYQLLPAMSDGPALLEHSKERGWEGIIAKRIASAYRQHRSHDWLKFKNTYSVSCVPVGYEPGEGARSHFGAMLLAMVDGTTVTQVGRVGTGFSEAETRELKARIDAKELFVVEIECLNRTASGVLRFPVYKGTRSDLSVLDATIDQLADLPLS